ncbi:MAG: apolipoprotein N-acyltransferase [Helicobacteraceae bacterium]|nr:apolipoprotein N-acyltransferase [Helicobacteraceae bacterium]
MKLNYSFLPATTQFIHAILLAFSFSAFIYEEYYGVSFLALNSLLAFYALFAFLTYDRKTIILAGFFIGELWFYWIGYSFEYYHVSYMIPIITIGFGLIYALFFGLITITNKPYFRALILFALSFFEPMDFNWMQIELIFIDSYFGILKWQFGLILLSLTFFIMLKNRVRYLALVLLLGSLNFSSTTRELPPLDIELVSMNLAQELKWLPETRESILVYNYKAIESAIENKKDLVVLSESAFPLYLNMHEDIIEKLKTYSEQIAIITGALLYEDENSYNVTYFFDQRSMQIAKKMVLVPFGEYIPLPLFMRDFINKTFFNGASDYLSADKPTDFIIKGVKFRNAVCYEATCKEIYEDNPKYVIATSNNAWFTPSIEPTLQRLLMKFYSLKYNTIIFHSANSAGTGILNP